MMADPPLSEWSRESSTLGKAVSASEAVLVREPLADTVGRVALLAGNAMIIVRNPVDDASKGIILSLSNGWADWRAPASVPGRDGVGRHIAHRIPVQTERLGGFRLLMGG